MRVLSGAGYTVGPAASCPLIPFFIPSREGWPAGLFFSSSPLGRGGPQGRGGFLACPSVRPTPPLRGTKRKRVLQQPSKCWTRFLFPSREGIKKLPSLEGWPKAGVGSWPACSSLCGLEARTPSGGTSCLPVFSFAGWKPALPGGEGALPAANLTTETGFELMCSVVVIGGEWMIKTLDGYDRETPL